MLSPSLYKLKASQHFLVVQKSSLQRLDQLWEDAGGQLVHARLGSGVAGLDGNATALLRGRRVWEVWFGRGQFEPRQLLVNSPDGFFEIRDVWVFEFLEPLPEQPSDQGVLEP
jgi:hypothetical protein